MEQIKFNFKNVDNQYKYIIKLIINKIKNYLFKIPLILILI